MTSLLIFSITLFLAVLLSELAGRSFLPMAVLFLTAGFFCGERMLGWIQVKASDPVVHGWLSLLFCRSSSGTECG